MLKKISELTFTGAIGATDEFEINAGGTNKRIFRDAIFAGAGGVTLGVNSGGAFVGITNADFAQIQVAGGNEIRFFQGADQVMTFDAAGNFEVAPATGVIALQGFGTAAIFLDAIGDVGITAAAGGTVHIMYVAANLGDWNTAPQEVWEALDRIAAEVAILKGSPIT